MSGELGTTNLLLGIMAIVSVLEALVMIGMAVAGVKAYGRVDDTANRVRSNVRAQASHVVGFVRGLRVAIEAMLHTRRQPYET